MCQPVETQILVWILKIQFLRIILSQRGFSEKSPILAVKKLCQGLP